MVARMLVECGVPSACMTSLSTTYPSLRPPSGYRATGFSTQSELLPSACMVELPSNPQLGRSARVGGCSNAFSRLLPRRPGTGVLPSSQMYSSLYFVMGRSLIVDDPRRVRKTLSHQLCLWPLKK